MSEERKDKKRKPLGLKLDGGPQKSGVAAESIRQSLPHGRSKTVIVEVKRGSRVARKSESSSGDSRFTDQEQSMRFRAVQGAMQEILNKQVLERQLQEEQRIQEEKRIKEEGLARQQEAEAALNARNNVSHSEISGSEFETPAVASRFTEEKKEVRKDKDKDGRKDFDKKSKSTDKIVERVDNERGPLKKTVPTKKKDGAGDGDFSRVSKVLLTEDHTAGKTYKPVFGIKKMRSRSKGPVGIANKPAQVLRCVEIKGSLSVSELSDKLSLKSVDVLKALLKMGEKLTINSTLDPDTIEVVVSELGHKSVRVGLDNLEEKLWNRPKNLTQSRPPVVTVMGHVDHGKTSLLDALRRTSVASREQGGITQHIGAYQVHLPSGALITFIDTPGHEAFTQMRARGANATDIVVLVVAADDGVKNQTVEAIRHAQAAGVPLIVAINKIDKPNARPDQVRNELLAYNVVVESLGGDVLEVEVSALAKKNLDKLEQAILLQAELMELKTDPDAPAQGVVIETHVKKGHGTLATVLLQNGVLKKGDCFVAGKASGRARLIFDDRGNSIAQASASQPVEVAGLSDIPGSGERFMVLTNEAETRHFVEWYKSMETSQESERCNAPAMTIDAHVRSQGMKDLTLVIKADVQGSLEGLAFELEKLVHDEVCLKIVYDAVGNVTESDALLAEASGAKILAFNVAVLPGAQKIIEKSGISLLKHRIIYHAIDDVKAALSGLLDPELQEVFLGRGEVIRLFPVKRAATIAGCAVKEGILKRGEMMRVMRDKKEIFKGTIRSLRHLKDDRKEVKEGYECGLTTENFNDYALGDQIHCYEIKTILRSFTEKKPS